VTLHVDNDLAREVDWKHYQVCTPERHTRPRRSKQQTAQPAAQGNVITCLDVINHGKAKPLSHVIHDGLRGEQRPKPRPERVAQLIQKYDVARVDADGCTPISMGDAVWQVPKEAMRVARAADPRPLKPLRRIRRITDALYDRDIVKAKVLDRPKPAGTAALRHEAGIRVELAVDQRRAVPAMIDRVLVLTALTRVACADEHVFKALHR
jgi:hypothetical protein